MTKINITNKTTIDSSKKYCEIILTEEKPNQHRLVEKINGAQEYRIGIGKHKNVTSRSFRAIIRTIVQVTKSQKIVTIAINLHSLSFPKLESLGQEWLCRTVAENLSLAQYEFKKYKTNKSDNGVTHEIVVYGVDTPAKKQSFLAGLTIGTSTNIARDIANTSGEDMTPSKLSAAARHILKDKNITVKILNKTAIKKEKMGLLEAVGKGANDDPNLIVIEYWGAEKAKTGKKASTPIALIGKGITYDTGGLNVKPSGYMHEMHMDMSGGAAIIATMHAIATLGIKKNVVAIIPTAENAISRDSMRAGDIATSMSGQTVEILHTDAEGRLVLADAMTYTEKYYAPRVMIDVATLTGASLVALGTFSSAVLTKDDILRDIIVKLGEETGDLMWPLPLWDEYKQSLKSHRADISNIAVDFSRYAGCIEGAAFLSHFAPKKTPWAHIDIAPRMVSNSSDKLTKGATGEPVRLLVRLVETY